MNLFCLIIPLCFALLTASVSPTRANDHPDALVGRWLSAKKRNQVEIYRQGDRYYGRLVWMIEPNDPVTQQPKLDKQNPDTRLRSRPLLNMPLLKNLVYKGDNVWTDGQIYNPEDGRTYSCEVTLKSNNTLDIRGYIMGMPFLGKTSTWTRVH